MKITRRGAIGMAAWGPGSALGPFH